MKKVVTADTGTKTTHYISSTYEYDVGRNEGTVYIFAGNMRVAAIKGNAVYYFHKDHLGSTSKTTNELGEEVERAEYMPFGSIRSDWALSGAVSDYKFTDQELDASTGLYNYDARLYDPAIGLFTSADSIVPDWYDPQSLNRYAYCRNSPVIYTDPSGNIVILGLAVWAAIEFTLSAVDVASTIDTLLDEDATLTEKVTSVVLTTAGIVAPGGGASTAVNVGRKGKTLLKGAAETAGTASKKIVIGENMERVGPYAKKIGAEVYEGMPGFKPGMEAEGLLHNKQIIQQKMTQGYEIIDIGPDFTRRAVRGGPQPAYQMERTITKGYEGYQKAFTRTGKDSLNLMEP